MFLKYVLLGMLLETLLIILIILFIKTNKNLKKYKEFQAKKKRREDFRKKMKELEIKWISNNLVMLKNCRPKIN